MPTVTVLSQESISYLKTPKTLNEWIRILDGMEWVTTEQDEFNNNHGYFIYKNTIIEVYDGGGYRMAHSSVKNEMIYNAHKFYMPNADIDDYTLKTYIG